MIWKRDEWAMYLVVMLITVIVLVSGQLLWHRYTVAKPLDKSLQEIQGIESVKWNDGDKSGTVLIEVTLHQVDNLEKTYGQIIEKSKGILGRKAFKVQLNDHRTPELAELYYKIHYCVQEAISNGNFVSMERQIQSEAKAAGVQSRIYVDSANVYIQLDKGSDALYTVVPRHADNTQGVRQ